MPSDSTLTLFIPDLFGFQSILATLSKDELAQLPETRFPILEKWLSRGLRNNSSNQQELLFTEFGILSDQDYSIAAFSLLAENTEALSHISADTYWLRADPIYLQADRDTALLLAHEELELTQDEANKLVAEINRHFIDEPWQLHALHPHRWYLELEKAHHLITHPLANVLGEDINQFLSVGDDASYWLKITNEIQMLLHGTNVNFERDSRGKLTANSIWLWGGGSLAHDKDAHCSYTKIITNNIYYKGIANYCDIDTVPLSSDLEVQSFVVLDILSEYVQRRDVYSFMKILYEIEKTYLAVCQNLLNENKVKEIKLISDHGFSINITSKLLRRWWKRIKPFPKFTV